MTSSLCCFCFVFIAPLYVRYHLMLRIKTNVFLFSRGLEKKRENANLCVLFIACRRQRDKTWNFIAHR